MDFTSLTTEPTLIGNRLSSATSLPRVAILTGSSVPDEVNAKNNLSALSSMQQPTSLPPIHLPLQFVHSLANSNTNSNAGQNSGTSIVNGNTNSIIHLLPINTTQNASTQSSILQLNSSTKVSPHHLHSQQSNHFSNGNISSNHLQQHHNNHDTGSNNNQTNASIPINSQMPLIADDPSNNKNAVSANSSTSLIHQSTLGGGHLNVMESGIVNEEGVKWTQFHVQQLWRHHAYLNGKNGISKDICGPNEDKFKEDGDPWNVEAQAAFLGPNLWDKTLPYDTDLKYADLDEFLSENNIPDGLPSTHLGQTTGLGNRPDSLVNCTSLSLSLGHVTTKRERSPSPSECVSPDTINPPSPAESTFSFASSGRDFDPRTRAFSDEELKPQPMIKKSRKQFVPDELKDDKYWARRRKNNIAAKRSRDARRQKENQIAMRARYLEKENSTLHQELEQLKQENMELRSRLSKYQEI